MCFRSLAKIMKFLIIFIYITLIYAQKPCIPKVYRGPDNPMTCVCNSTYCDEIPPLGTLGQNQAAIYTSTQSGKRFDRTNANFDTTGTANQITVKVDLSRKNQTIFGFGGAFTDSTGWNILELSTGAQQNLIQSYFGPTSIGYTVGRVPIASVDYSLSIYSYDDTPGDFNLTNFALQSADFTYKIPIIKQARDLNNGNLRLFASPWSAPGWMKESGKMQGGGPLIGAVNGQYYQTWANYITRFFEEYAKNNVTFWGLTMENEPEMGANLNYNFQAMFFNSTMERDFAKGYWGQALRSNPVTKNLKLMILDGIRGDIIRYSDDVFGDPDANNIVDGVAVHWYWDGSSSPTILTQAHEKYPNKFILYTEACALNPPKLGSWAEGDKYADDILNVLNNWVTGWTDWNMALNAQGGPSWVHNSFDSPIIVSNTTDEFEKQPMFYAVGHFSKFIVPDSVVVGIELGNAPKSLEGLAALTPSGQKVIVLLNRDVTANYSVSVYNTNNAWTNLNLEARSFTTIVFN